MSIQFENLGTENKNRVIIDGLSIWFSYQTPVAFYHPSTGRVVRENDWGTTTGKLLNELEPNKKLRVSGSRFEEMLAWFTITATKTYAEAK